MIDSFTKGPELEALLQATGKISTYEDMPQLRRSLIFGLKVSFLPVPPESLPQRGTKYSYFAVDTRSPTVGTDSEGEKYRRAVRLESRRDSHQAHRGT